MGDKSNSVAGFSLPSEFLTDKDEEKLDSNSDICFPTEFPYDFASFGSSSLTESEGDDDELVTGLTRHLARSSLVEANKLPTASFGDSTEKNRVMSGSPQSTLSPVFSNGSPNGGPSSPTCPFGSNDLSWDLICAAAGQVNTWKLQNEIKSRALLSGANNFTGFQTLSSPARLLNENELKPEFGSIWAQPQIYQNRGSRISAGNGYGVVGNVSCGRAQALPETAWPTLQYQKQQLRLNGCGLSAKPVFSGGRRYIGGGNGLKTKSAGTGVFLPRRYPVPVDSRDKSAQVPKPSYGNMNIEAQYIGGGVAPNPGLFDNAEAARMMMVMRRNASMAQQQWNNNMMMKKLMNLELGLPNEWSY